MRASRRDCRYCVLSAVADDDGVGRGFERVKGALTAEAYVAVNAVFESCDIFLDFGGVKRLMYIENDEFVKAGFLLELN